MTDREVVKQALLDYLGGERPRTVACLTGTWGCGKTYLWKDLARALEDKGKRTAYLSMFGIPSVASAKIALFNAVFVAPGREEDTANKARLKKVGEWGVKVLEAGFRAVDKKLGVDFFAKNVDLTAMVPSDTIVCLDDLERVSAEFRLEDVLGFANSLAEQGACRVLLIMNEEHLDTRFSAKQADIVRAYRERVVHRSLRMETDVRNLLPFLRTEHGIGLSDETCNVVLETLLRAENGNIRTVIRSLENAAELLAVGPTVDAIDASFVAALTSEHALGKLRPATYYEFHPVIFAIPRGSRDEPDEKAEAQRAFYQRYFKDRPYRASSAIYGLLRDGVLDKQAYKLERDEEAGLSVTRAGALLRRIDGREFWFLSDAQGSAWLDESLSVLLLADELRADVVNRIFTVAAVVAQILEQPVPQPLIEAAEVAMIAAARRLDRSVDRGQFHGETSLPDEVKKRYEDELAAATNAAHRGSLMDAILDRDESAFYRAVHVSPPESAEAALDPSLLAELHTTMRNDPHFWFKAIDAVGDVLKARQSSGIQQLAQYLGQAGAWAADKSDRRRAQELLRDLVKE
jgi:hypothetical protein